MILHKNFFSYFDDVKILLHYTVSPNSKKCIQYHRQSIERRGENSMDKQSQKYVEEDA